jgi:hypothetical protein
MSGTARSATPAPIASTFVGAVPPIQTLTAANTPPTTSAPAETGVVQSQPFVVGSHGGPNGHS